MRTEEQTQPSERYLFAEQYFSDKAISIWKAECIKRFKDKAKEETYEQYVNWIRKDNEIAVFTLYAHADFKIPKKFDIVFQVDNPANYIKEEYELTQSIFEAWCPMDNVNHGHKHLCVFKFKNNIPAIFEILHQEDQRFPTITNRSKTLGFCHSNDFEEIKQGRQKVNTDESNNH
jgi:hypothetical protein